MKTVKQSIWPVSVFGLGFLLLILGLSGRGKHSGDAPDSRTDISGGGQLPAYRAAGGSNSIGCIARGGVAAGPAAGNARFAAARYLQLLGELRARTEVNLDQLRILRSEQGGTAFDRLENALHTYLDAVDVEFRNGPSGPPDLPLDTLGSQTDDDFCGDRRIGEIKRRQFRISPQSAESIGGESAGRYLGNHSDGADFGIGDCGGQHFPHIVIGAGDSGAPASHRASRRAAAVVIAATGVVAGTGTQGTVARAAR